MKNILLYLSIVSVLALFLLSACTPKEQVPADEIAIPSSEIEELQENPENKIDSSSPPGINVAEKCPNILIEAEKYFKLDFEEIESARYMGSCQFNAYGDEVYTHKITNLKVQKECLLRDESWQEYKESTINSLQINEVEGPVPQGVFDYFYASKDNGKSYESYVYLYFKNPEENCAYMILGGIWPSARTAASADAIANFKYLALAVNN